jgi:hypothetical protein
LCIPSAKTGTFWEIDFILTNNHLSKTIFIMPSQLAGGIYKFIFQKNFESGECEDDWAKLIIEVGKRGVRFPEYDKNGLLFCPGTANTELRCRSLTLGSP